MNLSVHVCVIVDVYVFVCDHVLCMFVVCVCLCVYVRMMCGVCVFVFILSFFVSIW